MTDLKISQLPVATSAAGSDVLVLNQGITTKQVTVQDFLTSFGLWQQPPSQTSAITAYSTVSGLSSSTQYTVTVNGVTVPTTKYEGHSYAWFALEPGKNADVQVNCGQTVTSYVLSPQRIAPTSSINGQVISFRLTQMSKLLLRSVNAIAERLTIFADPVETSVPASSGTGIYNVVTQYGAPTNNTGNAETAINNAITAANAAGGGIVYCPAGQYRIGSSVFNKSNVSIYLAPGAVWRLVQTTIWNTSTAIHVNGVTDAKMYGRGVIYGQGSLPGATFGHALHTNSAVRFTWNDLMIIDVASTAFRVGGTDTNSMVHNLKEIGFTASGLCDGIDMDGGPGTLSGFTVEDSYISSSDDAFAIGSGTGDFAGGTPGSVANVTLQRNLLVRPVQGHSLSIVPHFNGGGNTISGILFDQNDSVYLNSDPSGNDAFSIYPFGGCNVSNVTIKNSRTEGTYKKAFDFLQVDCTSWGPGNCGQPAGICGYIHTVTAQNLTFDSYGTANSLFQAFVTPFDISGVTFNNVFIGGVHVISNATGHFDVQGTGIAAFTFI